ncbi:MAG TPA: hypothetical protein VET89_13375 [Stellaceae bacterium]|jgi:hypothetical protein|nr:hypothetical protein [Stellaceae bacterium]
MAVIGSWRARLALCLAILIVAGPVVAQRLLYGRWQARLADSVAVLTVITVDGDGWIHGTLYYEPPLGGFGGAPFTTRIENGEFAIRFADGTRYGGMHWCGAILCGTYHALDETAIPVLFNRAE